MGRAWLWPQLWWAWLLLCRVRLRVAAVSASAWGKLAGASKQGGVLFDQQENLLRQKACGIVSVLRPAHGWPGRLSQKRAERLCPVSVREGRERVYVCSAVLTGRRMYSERLQMLFAQREPFWVVARSGLG